jgi:hypothetical protein
MPKLTNFTDLGKVYDTQNGVQAFIKKAAAVLAEAGEASAKATGDNADYAIRRWSRIMEDEALRILAYNRRVTALPSKKGV